MTRETKFNYGLLFVGLALPIIAEYSLGRACGVIVAIVVLVIGGLLLISGHTHPERGMRPSRRKKLAKYAAVGALLSLGIIGIRAVYAHESIASDAPVQSNAAQSSPSTSSVAPQSTQSPTPPPVIPLTTKEGKPTKRSTTKEQTPTVTPPVQSAQPQTIGPITQGQGSAMSFNQQGGITAGTIEVDTDRVLTDQSAPKLVAQILDYSAAAYFSCIGGTPEQQNLAQQLAYVLQQVQGWEKSRPGAANAITRGAIHGIEVKIPSGQEQAGEALVKGLQAAGFAAYSAPRGAAEDMFIPKDALDVYIGSKR